MYVTYDYYKNEYQGTLVTANEFDKLEREARFTVINITRKKHRIQQLLSFGKYTEEIKTCMCELIDNIKQSEVLLNNALQSDLIQAQGISSRSVKNSSVSFKSDKELTSNTINQQVELQNNAIVRKYLSPIGLLYRGL